ncbi:hypothetical protein Tco_0672156 [Tanacetum coccineum]
MLALPISLSLQLTEIALYGLLDPTSVISLDMARHPCPWEVKMSDPGRERVSFFTRPRLGEIVFVERVYAPGSFLLSLLNTPPSFRGRSLGEGDRFCLSLLKTLATGFGSACAHAFFSALSGQLAFWIRSNGTLHGFLDFSQIHCVDSCGFPIFVPLYTGGVLEKDSAPHLTARQEQTVKLLESHKAPFRRYPECFLCLVVLSPYYPFDKNSYPAFEHPDGTDMGLLDFIKTADPRKVRAVEVQKGDDQVTLLESTRHCFMPLVIPAAGGSSSVAATKIPAPTEGGQEDVAEENAYLELADPDEGRTMVRQSEEEVVTEQPKKIKKKRLIRHSDVLPAKKLRTDHPSLASSTGESKSFVDLSAQASLQIRTTVGSSSTLSAPVDIVAATTTSTKAKLAANVNPDLAGFSQLEELEGSDDSFYELATFNPSEAKRAARQICLGSELLEEKDLEILRLKSQLAEKEAEAAEVIRLRDQVSSLSGEKSTLTVEVSALKVTITQKDNDISLLDSRVTHLASSLDDAKVACAEAGTEITSLASERDRLASEVSSLRAGFQDFKEKMEVQQEEQAQELKEVDSDLWDTTCSP